MQHQMHGTTILAVRRGRQLVIAGDGQVTMGGLCLKRKACKVQRLAGGNVLVGFSGVTADALTLTALLEQHVERFPKQLMRACAEMAKAWRVDQQLQRLNAMLIVADSSETFMISGSGDVVSPDVPVLAVGAGGAYAQAAGLALYSQTYMSPKEIAEKAMAVTAELCIYTSDHISYEVLDE